MTMNHHEQLNFQLMAMRFAIKFTARASGFKPSSTLRHSLTFRSSRHLQASLVGSLRATHSGAAYL
jgi:Cu/Ag efflux protein CusF